jgi:hypothetical protein
MYICILAFASKTMQEEFYDPQALPLQALGPMAIGYDCYRSLWNKLEKQVLEKWN